MMKNGSGRENVGEEGVVAVQLDADFALGLRAGRISNHKLRRVGALTADQRAADFPGGGTDRHSFRQRGKAEVRGEGKGVGRRATGGGDGATLVGCPLRSPGARAGGD